MLCRDFDAKHVIYLTTNRAIEAIRSVFHDFGNRSVVHVGDGVLV